MGRIENILQPNDLHRIFEYDAETGVLVWKYDINATKSRNTRFAGKQAGSENSYGYLIVNLTSYHPDKKQTFAIVSRVCWAMHTGYWPIGQIDHKNRSTLDNRFYNLRDVTYSQNRMNQIAHNATGYKGVGYNKSFEQYFASITKDGKAHYLGSFKRAVDAAIAYDNAAIELFGEFARVNSYSKEELV